VALQQAGMTTVGFAHQIVLRGVAAGLQGFDTAVFYVAFTLGIWMLSAFTIEDVAAIRQKNFGPDLLLSATLWTFLLIMPFSYQIWEKYLILVLPVAASRLNLLKRIG
jgi:hypothetical protein